MPLEEPPDADEGLLVETLQCALALDGSTQGFVKRPDVSRLLAEEEEIDAGNHSLSHHFLPGVSP